MAKEGGYRPARAKIPPITNDFRPAADNGLNPNGSLEEIIAFCSDRNLKDRMIFENPKVKYDVNLSEWHKDSAPITKTPTEARRYFIAETEWANCKSFIPHLYRKDI